jgi:hypothetical protein
MGRNPVVVLERRRGAGGLNAHRGELLDWHVGCHEQHAAIVQQR